MTYGVGGIVIPAHKGYGVFVEVAGEGFCILDSKGRLTFANASMGAFVGWPPEELVGRPLFELVEEEFIAPAAEQLRAAGTVGRGRCELRYRHKSGIGSIGMTTVASFKGERELEGFVLSVMDVTGLREAERSLIASREISSEIGDIISENLAVIDPVNYRIIQANRPLARRLNHEHVSTLLGKPCYEVIMGRGRPCPADGFPCLVRQAYETHRPVEIERSFPDAGGQARLFQISGYPLRGNGAPRLIIRIERDITDKRRMEEALASRSTELQKAQQRLETLIEMSRQMSSKGSTRDVVHAIMEITRKICPDSTPLLFLLNPGHTNFLRLETCQASVSVPLAHMLRRMEQSGSVLDFIRYLNTLRGAPILSSGSGPRQPDFMSILEEKDPTWFAIPIFVQNQCVGLFFVGLGMAKIAAQDDVRFLHALLDQVAGHLYQLVLHEAEISQLRQHFVERAACGEIIGQSRVMQDVYELIGLVSSSDATVLITGENGTGKELVAQAVHSRSHRSKGPFVVANCSAYSPTLLESEIFGHEKGAFTGAIRQKKGRIERAHGGTLFLDEIGDTGPAIQILLLRFLQDHCFERVGGETTIAADVRVLAATNRNLRQEVAEGRFRDDLYYRLNVISIHLPPLRERKEDIPLLCQHFLKKYNLKEGKRILKFAPEAMQLLMDYEWPGNVRQLENAVSHAVVLAQENVVRMNHLPRFLRESSGQSHVTSLEDNERQLILRVLNDANWNKHEAARRLKISRSTLYSMIHRYGLVSETRHLE